MDQHVRMEGKMKRLMCYVENENQVESFCNCLPCWMVPQDVRCGSLAPRPHLQAGGSCVPPGAAAPNPYPGTQDTPPSGPDKLPPPAAVAAVSVPEAGNEGYSYAMVLLCIKINQTNSHYTHYDT